MWRWREGAASHAPIWGMGIVGGDVCEQALVSAWIGYFTRSWQDFIRGGVTREDPLSGSPDGVLPFFVLRQVRSR